MLCLAGAVSSACFCCSVLRRPPCTPVAAAGTAQTLHLSGRHGGCGEVQGCLITDPSMKHRGPAGTTATQSSPWSWSVHWGTGDTSLGRCCNPSSPLQGQEVPSPSLGGVLGQAAWQAAVCVGAAEIPPPHGGCLLQDNFGIPGAYHDQYCAYLQLLRAYSAPTSPAGVS